MFPKTQTPIARGWKQGMKFSCPEKPDKSEPKSIKRSPIKTIGERTKRRLKEHGSEKDMFLKIWEKRPHECEKCRHPLTVPKPHNFDHKVPKSAGEKYRYDESNIQILCFACHFEKTTGLKYKGINLD